MMTEYAVKAVFAAQQTVLYKGFNSPGRLKEGDQVIKVLEVQSYFSTYVLF